MATKENKFWMLLIFLLSGLVIGGLLGKLLSGISGVWWLSYEQQFGLENPIVLDLNIFKLTLGFIFKINIASVIGLLISLLIYKKI